MEKKILSDQIKQSEIQKFKEALKKIEEQEERERNQKMTEELWTDAAQELAKKRNKSQEHKGQEIKGGKENLDKLIDSEGSLDVLAEALSDFEQRVEEVTEELGDDLLFRDFI